MIIRERLSTDVHQELLGRIIRGESAPGQRLRDTDLAEELGVSRTPVREALLRLEKEGFISSQKHLGFTVKKLEASEINEVYPLVSLLECSALDSSPMPSLPKMRRLGELSRALRDEGADPFRRIELDSSWHEALIDDSGNACLLRILSDLKTVLFRYEYAFMQNDDLVAQSIAEHAAIALSLKNGKRKDAVRLLKAHWDRCTAATLAEFFATEGRA
jgi:DNA-binding GntR family transcriptional regulator